MFNQNISIPNFVSCFRRKSIFDESRMKVCQYKMQIYYSLCIQNAYVSHSTLSNTPIENHKYSNVSELWSNECPKTVKMFGMVSVWWWLKFANDWNFDFYSVFNQVSNILGRMKLELKASARQLVSGSMIIEFIMARDDRRRVLVEIALKCWIGFLYVFLFLFQFSKNVVFAMFCVFIFRLENL